MAGELTSSSFQLCARVFASFNSTTTAASTDVVIYRSLEAIPVGRLVYESGTSTTGARVKSAGLASCAVSNKATPVGMCTVAATAANRSVSVAKFTRSTGLRLRLSVIGTAPYPSQGLHYVLGTDGKIKPLYELASGNYVTYVGFRTQIYDGDYDYGCNGGDVEGDEEAFWLYCCPTGRMKP